MAHELKRKDINLKELQTRLEAGDGCKFHSNIGASPIKLLSADLFIRAYTKRTAFIILCLLFG